MFNHVGIARGVDKIVDLDTLTVRDVTAAELALSGKTLHGKIPFAMYARAMKHQFIVQVASPLVYNCYRLC